ncbi:ABC transporter substrate-binding protein [Streptomyces sp. NPDC051162]|uniref:ABC transporter substrate-binding protein n=1 Tax=Streptomyces sp. NPDC051162 TaxID=3154747 RepID=UPI00343A2E29
MTGASGTRPYLIRRLATLLVGTLLACAALLTAYYGVSRNSPAVNGRTTPAIVEIAAAETSLKASFTAARSSLTGPAGPVEGAGEEYRAQLNAANQALEKATINTVAGDDGRQTLRTASGLVSSYGYLIEQAVRSGTDAVLRDAYVASAHSTLTRPGSGIVDRLEEVQHDQREVLGEQVSFGWLLTLAWITAFALCAGLIRLLADTQRTLRRRFRRRVNPALAAGTALLAALALTLAVLAVQIQGRLHAAAAHIEHDRTHGGIRAETLHWVNGTLRSTQWRAALTGYVVLAGVLIAALVLIGLQPRIDEYRFRHPVPAGHAESPMSVLLGTRDRGQPVTAALLAFWLVVTGAVAYGDRQGEHPGRVTVLASWSGLEQQRFEKVLRAFTKRTHRAISVSYQGTTAQRELLLSRERTGDPPDIAILPSRGEAADYAARDALTPLDGVLPKSTLDAYGPQWTSRAAGRVYAVPVKAELKSIAWYDAAAPPPDLPALAADGTHWCAGMGGDDTSGWPGTDWIEDILLQQSGTRVYEQLANGGLAWDSDVMARAWRTFGSIFTAGPARTALAEDYTQGLFHASGPGACVLEHQGTFIRNGYPKDRHPDFVPSPRLLPGADRNSTAREVSADYAALFHDSPEARELLRFLTTEEAQRVWSEPDKDRPGNPFRPFFPFSKNRPSPPVPPDEPLNAHIDRELRSAGALCLDASDSMPPRMRFAFQHGVLDYLSAPAPSKLGQVLRDLETVRRGIPPREDHACGSG